MDDKNKVYKLYERMNYINFKIINTTSKIEYLEEELDKSLKLDNKTYEKEKIENNKDKINSIKENIKYNIINDLKKHL